jgi:hypothetical protein
MPGETSAPPPVVVGQRGSRGRRAGTQRDHRPPRNRVAEARGATVRRHAIIGSFPAMGRPFLSQGIDSVITTIRPLWRLGLGRSVWWLRVIRTCCLRSSSSGWSTFAWPCSNSCLTKGVRTRGNGRLLSVQSCRPWAKTRPSRILRSARHRPTSSEMMDGLPFMPRASRRNGASVSNAGHSAAGRTEEPQRAPGRTSNRRRNTRTSDALGRESRFARFRFRCRARRQGSPGSSESGWPAVPRSPPTGPASMWTVEPGR